MQKLRDISKPIPNHDLIESLRALLRDAESGDLQDMIYAAGWTGDRYSHGWHLSDRCRRLSMMGEHNICLHEMVDDVQLSRPDSVLIEFLNDAG